MMKLHESLRFVIVGILNTVVGFAVYFLCVYFLGLHYTLSLVISHIIGVCHSYYWNNKWTFKAGKVEAGTIYKFITVYGITFSLNLLLLSVLIFFMNQIFAQAIALMITTMISFVGHKYWSFRKNRTESGADV